MAELIRKSNINLALKNAAGNASTKSVMYRKYGHTVIVDFYDICPPSLPAGASVVIAEGLPKPAFSYSVTTLTSITKAVPGLRVAINSVGQLVYWWAGVSIDLQTTYTGQLMYFTDN